LSNSSWANYFVSSQCFDGGKSDRYLIAINLLVWWCRNICRGDGEGGMLDEGV
jgi:hypothetical protein